MGRNFAKQMLTRRRANQDVEPPEYEWPMFDVGTKIVTLGDSITQVANYCDATYTKISNQGDSYIGWAMLDVPGFVHKNYYDVTATDGAAAPYFRGANYGLSGDALSDIADRLTPVINSGAQIVVLLGGTNSGTGDSTAAVKISKIDEIIAALNAEDIYVIVGTIWPRTTRASPTGTQISPAEMAEILETNEYIRSLNLPMVKVWDPWEDLVDSAYTEGVDANYGSPLTGMLRDDVHPAPKGAYTASRSLNVILKEIMDHDLYDDTWFNSNPTQAANRLLDGEFANSAGTVNNGVTGSAATNWTIGFLTSPTYGSGVASLIANADTTGQTQKVVLSCTGAGGATAFEQFQMVPSGFRVDEPSMTNGAWVQLMFKVRVVNNTGGILGALRCQLRNSTQSKFGHGMEHTNGTRQTEPWPVVDFEGWIISEPVQYATGNTFIPTFYADVLANKSGSVEIFVDAALLLEVEAPQTTFPYTP